MFSIYVNSFVEPRLHFQIIDKFLFVDKFERVWRAFIHENHRVCHFVGMLEDSLVFTENHKILALDDGDFRQKSLNSNWTWRLTRNRDELIIEVKIESANTVKNQFTGLRACVKTNLPDWEHVFWCQSFELKITRYLIKKYNGGRPLGISRL